ncbi:hypothetical protein BH09ACT12_BH09ACT12_32680 [soil metagenome]
MSNQYPDNSGQGEQPPQPPNAYGAPSYGGYPAVPDHPQATTILVLGIVSVFFGVVGPVAWYMGSKAKKEIEASGGRLGGLQQVTVGWILGIIMSILLAVSVVILLFVFVAVLGVFASVS